MKKSTMIYIMMFACMFILPSFIIPQDKKEAPTVVHKLSKDSVAVSLYFQTSGALEKKFNTTTETNSKLIDVIDTLYQGLNKVVALQQEGRCESSMDRIKQATGYSEEQIKHVFTLERKLNVFYGISTLIFIIACLTIYVTSFTRYRGLVAIQLLVCCLVYGGVLLLTKYLLPSLYGIDYQQFFQLLKHVPV